MPSPRYALVLLTALGCASILPPAARAQFADTEVSGPDLKEGMQIIAALCETMGLIIAAGQEFGHEVQRSFFAKHLEPWMGQFFTDLANAEAACFYRAVGHLGQQFVDLERQYFSMPA